MKISATDRCYINVASFDRPVAAGYSHIAPENTGKDPDLAARLAANIGDTTLTKKVQDSIRSLSAVTLTQESGISINIQAKTPTVASQPVELIRNRTSAIAPLWAEGNNERIGYRSVLNVAECVSFSIWCYVLFLSSAHGSIYFAAFLDQNDKLKKL